jgi:SAM-dependent methyltransferase
VDPGEDGAEPAAFEGAYFRHVYDEGGEQRWTDRARDRLVARLVRTALGATGGSVLDIGCGYGWFLRTLGEGFERFGVDVSASAVEIARAALPGARLEVADVQEGLPWSGPFDAVVAVNVIEHLTDPASAIRTMAAALQPGGVLVAHLPTVGWTRTRIYERDYTADPTHVYRPTPAAFRRLLEDGGFRLDRWTHAPYAPWGLWHAIPWHPAHMAVARRVAG